MKCVRARISYLVNTDQTQETLHVRDIKTFVLFNSINELQRLSSE